MLPPRAFSIEMRVPQHGWLDLALVFDVEEFGFPASDVLNDPVRELAEMAHFIASGDRGTVQVRFWLEPGGYALSATRTDVLDLSLHRSEMASPDLLDPTLVLQHRVEPEIVVQQIAHCLRTAQPNFTREHWSYPFPNELVALLPREQ